MDNFLLWLFGMDNIMFDVMVFLQVYLETPKGEKLAEALRSKVTLITGNLSFVFVFKLDMKTKIIWFRVINGLMDKIA